MLVFAGAASLPAAEEAARFYEQANGVKVELAFGGSGQVLSQMKLARQGDLYFPGSSDFMEIAKREGEVIADSERIVAYLVPAIAVRAGNPERIRSLQDLARPGLRIAIADPESVCLGLHAVEIVDTALAPEEKAAFKRNLVNFAESCEKTATAVSLRMVDAVIGWRVFEHWDPERIEIVRLQPEQIRRIGYLPVAISKYARDRAAAQGFIEFLSGAEGQAIFKRHGYFVTAEEAAAWVGAEKPVGGANAAPEDWIRR